MNSISFEVYVLILHECLLEIWINHMRLIMVHSESVYSFESFGFKLTPCLLLDQELSCDFVPPLLPVDSCVQYLHSHLINSGIQPYECKPAVCHCSELIIVLNKSIVIKFIFIEYTLVVELHLVLRA